MDHNQKVSIIIFKLPQDKVISKSRFVDAYTLIPYSLRKTDQLSLSHFCISFTTKRVSRSENVLLAISSLLNIAGIFNRVQFLRM